MRHTFPWEVMEHEGEESIPESERAFQQAFLDMKSIVEELYREWRKDGASASKV